MQMFALIGFLVTKAHSSSLGPEGCLSTRLSKKKIINSILQFWLDVIHWKID